MSNVTYNSTKEKFVYLFPYEIIINLVILLLSLSSIYLLFFKNLKFYFVFLSIFPLIHFILSVNKPTKYHISPCNKLNTRSIITLINFFLIKYTKYFSYLFAYYLFAIVIMYSLGLVLLEYYLIEIYTLFGVILSVVNIYFFISVSESKNIMEIKLSNIYEGLISNINSIDFFLTLNKKGKSKHIKNIVATIKEPLSYLRIYARAPGKSIENFIWFPNVSHVIQKKLDEFASGDNKLKEDINKYFDNKKKEIIKKINSDYIKEEINNIFSKVPTKYFIFNYGLASIDVGLFPNIYNKESEYFSYKLTEFYNWVFDQFEKIIFLVICGDINEK